MREMIWIQVLEDGRWEIQVAVKEKGKWSKRGKRCHI